MPPDYQFPGAGYFPFFILTPSPPASLRVNSARRKNPCLHGSSNTESPCLLQADMRGFFALPHSASNDRLKSFFSDLTGRRFPGMLSANPWAGAVHPPFRLREKDLNILFISSFCPPLCKRVRPERLHTPRAQITAVQLEKKRQESGSRESGKAGMTPGNKTECDGGDCRP